MKKLTLLLCCLGLLSCTPSPVNTPETLEKVFAKDEFEIEVHQVGCFFGGTESFTLELKPNGYLLQSDRTRKSHLVEASKIDSLKNFLKPRIGQEENGYCTLSQYIRIGTFFHSVDYMHNHCSGIEATFLNDFLKYEELITDTENKE